jgi:glutathione peroxidase
MIGMMASTVRAPTMIARIPKVAAAFHKSSASSFNGSAITAPKTTRRSKAVLIAGGATIAMFGSASAQGGSVYDFTVTSIDGKEVPMSQFKDKVLLVVNVASACGFTPQYKDFVELYGKYKSQGFEVLAFPCNQFGSQEPGSNSEVKSFASRQGATFPMFAKSDVNGPNSLPLFKFLKEKQGGLLTSDIKWNFTKFLVDKKGNVVKRYASTATGAEIEKDVKALL